MNTMIKNKKGIEFSFSWLFAIIVGGAVIFIAIYASSRFIGGEQKLTNSEAALAIGAILSPSETGVETSILPEPIDTKVPTRLYLDCSLDPFGTNTGKTFGKQTIQVSVSTSTGSGWSTPGIAGTFYNKYLFGNKTIEDKREIYVLTIPFKYPFKIADLQILFSDKQNYCFVNAPEDFKNILNGSSIPSISFKNSKGDCITGNIKVCFQNTAGCNIVVDLTSNSVTKNGKTLYYESSNSESGNSLMYGAIFSDPDLYECQVKRLSKRMAELSSLYIGKNNLMTGTSCSSNLGVELGMLQSSSRSLTSSSDINQMGTKVKEVNDKNEAQNCKLF